MAQSSGRGDPDSATRSRLLDATAAIMLSEGYAAATSRKIAARAGVKQALVYYYFPTMDDLFVALIRREAEAILERQRRTLSDSDPLRTLWTLNSDRQAGRLSTELMALANHRKVIGAELKALAERIRDMESAVVTMVLRAHGIDLDDHPPVVMAMALSSLARLMANEEGVDMTRGHADVEAYIERLLTRLSMEPRTT